MGNTVYKDDLPEVLIHRHQDAPLRGGPFEQRSITRVGTTFARFRNAMPLLAQPVGETPTGSDRLRTSLHLYRVQRILRNDSVGIGQAGPHILARKARIICEDRIFGFTLGKEA